MLGESPGVGYEFGKIIVNGQKIRQNVQMSYTLDQAIL